MVLSFMPRPKMSWGVGGGDGNLTGATAHSGIKLICFIVFKGDSSSTLCSGSENPANDAQRITSICFGVVYE